MKPRRVSFSVMIGSRLSSLTNPSDTMTQTISGFASWGYGELQTETRRTVKGARCCATKWDGTHRYQRIQRGDHDKTRENLSYNIP